MPLTSKDSKKEPRTAHTNVMANEMYHHLTAKIARFRALYFPSLHGMAHLSRLDLSHTSTVQFSLCRALAEGL